MKDTILKLKNEIAKHVIGHEDVVDTLLIGLFTNGHILLEGLPGLAKTTMANAIARSLSLAFKRVQFTPDLLPSDILGAEIYDVKNAEFTIKYGPVFTNILLADEINRAPAKVQSALLEVMQENQVTLGDTTHKITTPFLVIATQNPLEQEGVYKLPEAQLDRFMFQIAVGYNSEIEEFLIAQKVANESFEEIEPILLAEDLLFIKEEIKKVHIDDSLLSYIVRLIFATREPAKYGLESLDKLIKFGASPRATIDLLKASKARAYLRGHEFVTPVDISLCFKDVLRHRIVLSFEAISQGISSDTILDRLIQSLEM